MPTRQQEKIDILINTTTSPVSSHAATPCPASSTTLPVAYSYSCLHGLLAFSSLLIAASCSFVVARAGF
jgi:hypothetical protein